MATLHYNLVQFCVVQDGLKILVIFLLGLYTCVAGNLTPFIGEKDLEKSSWNSSEVLNIASLFLFLSWGSCIVYACFTTAFLSRNKGEI